MDTEDIATKEDLERLKRSLIEEFNNVFQKYNVPFKRYLRTQEVAKMLKITPRTIQNYRDRVIIKYSQIVGTIIYDYEDIIEFIEIHKIR